jgi:hypothetical protein
MFTRTVYTFVVRVLRWCMEFVFTRYTYPVRPRWKVESRTFNLHYGRWLVQVRMVPKQPTSRCKQEQVAVMQYNGWR